MAPETSNQNRHIAEIGGLSPPRQLRDELPLTPQAERVVREGRETVTSILDGGDDRLLVVVGPCSIHDPVAGLAYAARLASLAVRCRDELFVVMRTYFEKPRTTVGWKGLINDPDLDGTFKVGEGLFTARKFLLDVLSLGIPVGCEFLDPITAEYVADAVSWGAIGARTTQSQIHRQLASGLSMPVGFKNPPGDGAQDAVDAVAAARRPQVFPGIDSEGRAAVLRTSGNADAHVVLRGTSAGSNYDRHSVADTMQRLAAAGLPQRVVVDVSHANSGKDHRRQPGIAVELACRRAAGERGLVGLMLESFLVEGRQDFTPGNGPPPRFGQSITDGCIDWQTTEEVLERLSASGSRRHPRPAAPPPASPTRLERPGWEVPEPGSARASSSPTVAR